jgi:predicted porin
MKKSLLALAVLGAFAGVASAQTSVTIYGSFDGGVRHVNNVDAAGNNRTTVGSNGTYNSNRLGFKGVEDLGGGLNAHFNLESGFNTGTGAVDGTLFNRTASVGLGGAWGSLDIGHQYNVAFRTIGYYDPMSYKYTGIAYAVPATAGVRFDNDIQYTGTFGGVTARAEYALGEVAGSNSTGSKKAIGLAYAAGPFSLAGAYTNRDVATFDNDHWTIGGAYTFGGARVTLGYVDEKQATAAVTGDNTSKFAWVGLSYAITPAAEITGAFYQNKLETAGVDGKRNLFMLSATYALSKRTNLYAELDHTKLDGSARLGTAATGFQDRVTGVSVGVNHLF